jgi:hypothetical protein
MPELRVLESDFVVVEWLEASVVERSVITVVPCDSPGVAVAPEPQSFGASVLFTQKGQE